jgi:hypothetical protein
MSCHLGAEFKESNIIIWGAGDTARKAITFIEVALTRSIRYITSGVRADGLNMPFGLNFISRENLRSIPDSILVICSSAYLDILKDILVHDLFDPDSIYIYGDHELAITSSFVDTYDDRSLIQSQLSSSGWDIPAQSKMEMSPLRRLTMLPAPKVIKLFGESPIKYAENSDNIHLFFPYYKSEESERQLEIDECLVRNLSNPHFKSITVIADGDIPEGLIKKSPRVIVIPNEGRLSFGKWIQLVADRKYRGIVLLCNADIYFDESVSRIHELIGLKSSEPSAAAISRYDVLDEQAVLHIAPHFSQDAWAFHSKYLEKMPIGQLEEIYLGTKRCDSKLAFWLADAGLRLINPCHFVHAFHLHQTGQRTYKNKYNYDNLGANLYVYPIDRIGTKSWLEYVYYQRAPYYVVRSRIVNWF